MPPKPPKPSFVKAPPDLVEQFNSTLASIPETSTRKVFGYPAGFVNGNMATGLYRATWFVRLPDDAVAELCAAGGYPFEPMAGRPMRSHIVMPPSIMREPAAVRRWVERAIVHTGSLPPKR